MFVFSLIREDCVTLEFKYKRDRNLFRRNLARNCFISSFRTQKFVNRKNRFASLKLKLQEEFDDSHGTLKTSAKDTKRKSFLKRVSKSGRVSLLTSSVINVASVDSMPFPCRNTTTCRD